MSFFSRDISTSPNSSNIMIESAAYAGIATLLLAPFAFFHRNRRYAFFFLGLIVFCVEVAAGWEPGYWISTHIPLLSGVKNWRLLVVADFGLAVLAGLGVSCLSEERRWDKRAWIPFSAIFLGCVYATWVLHHRRVIPVDQLRSPRSTGALVLVSALLIVLAMIRRIDARKFVTGMALLVCLDMTTFAYGANGFARRDHIFPPAPLFEFLQNSNPLESRVVNLDDSYSPNSEMMYGLYAVGGYEISLRSIKHLLDDFSVPHLDAISIKSDKLMTYADRRLDLMNAKYFIITTYSPGLNELLSHPERFKLVYSKGTQRVFENLHALPRALFVPARSEAFEVIPSEDAQLERLRTSVFDPETAVILENIPAELSHTPKETTDDSRAISWMSRNANGFSLRTSGTQPGVLTISEIFYPGWRVWIDDAPATLLRTNYAFFGAAIPPGEHVVRFEFHSRSLTVGAVVTLVSLLVFVGVLIFAWKKGDGVLRPLS